MSYRPEIIEKDDSMFRMNSAAEKRLPRRLAQSLGARLAVNPLIRDQSRSGGSDRIDVNKMKARRAFRRALLSGGNIICRFESETMEHGELFAVSENFRALRSLDDRLCVAAQPCECLAKARAGNSIVAKTGRKA